MSVDLWRMRLADHLTREARAFAASCHLDEAVVAEAAYLVVERFRASAERGPFTLEQLVVHEAAPAAPSRAVDAARSSEDK